MKASVFIYLYLGLLASTSTVGQMSLNSPDRQRLLFNVTGTTLHLPADHCGRRPKVILSNSGISGVSAPVLKAWLNICALDKRTLIFSAPFTWSGFAWNGTNNQHGGYAAGGEEYYCQIFGMKSDFTPVRTDFVKFLLTTKIISFDDSDLSGVYFSSNSAGIPGDSMKVLQSMGKIFTRLSNATFILEGHAGYQETLPHNSLALARAEAVRQYFFQYCQIPLSRMTAISKGSTEAITNDRACDSDSPNRKVVVLVKGITLEEKKAK